MAAAAAVVVAWVVSVTTAAVWVWSVRQEAQHGARGYLPRCTLAAAAALGLWSPDNWEIFTSFHKSMVSTSHLLSLWFPHPTSGSRDLSVPFCEKLTGPAHAWSPVHFGISLAIPTLLPLILKALSRSVKAVIVIEEGLSQFVWLISTILSYRSSGVLVTQRCIWSSVANPLVPAKFSNLPPSDWVFTFNREIPLYNGQFMCPARFIHPTKSPNKESQSPYPREPG